MHRQGQKKACRCQPSIRMLEGPRHDQLACHPCVLPGCGPFAFPRSMFPYKAPQSPVHSPHKWAIGHTTFEFSFPLPEPANSGNCSKTKKKQSETPPRKTTPSTPPSNTPPKARKLQTKPDSASVETKKQKRDEYDRQRNQTPERKEYHRRLVQVRQRKAKELGKCRNCSKPAIPDQTRCPTCAENHRQSRRRSDV